MPKTKESRKSQAIRKATEVGAQATRIAEHYTCLLGGANAERILKLAYEKVKVKNVLLQEKYKEAK